MSRPVIFSVKTKPNMADAINFVSVSIRAHNIFYMKDGNPTPLDRKALMRGGVLCEVVSSSYSLIKHEDILALALNSTKSHEKEIMSIGLDSGSDRMLARIQFLKDFEVAPGDVIRPEILVLNSYDHTFGVGFDLGFFRVSCENVALTNHSERWTHHSVSHDFDTINEALVFFEKSVVPEIKKMVKMKISEETAAKIIAKAEQEGVLPRKLARKLVGAAGNTKALSLWDLLNGVTFEITHEVDISPSHRRALWKNTGDFFFSLDKQKIESIEKSVTKKDIETLLSTKRERNAKKTKS